MCTQTTGTYCNRTSSQVSGSLESLLHKPAVTRPVPGLLEERMNFLFTSPTITEIIYGKGAGKIPRLSLTSWELLKLIFIQKGVNSFVGWGVDFLNKEMLVTSSRYRYALQWNLISGKFIPRSNLESSANQASPSPLHSDPKNFPRTPPCYQSLSRRKATIPSSHTSPAPSPQPLTSDILASPSPRTPVPEI